MCVKDRLRIPRQKSRRVRKDGHIPMTEVGSGQVPWIQTAEPEEPADYEGKECFRFHVSEGKVAPA
jgi:hypothetical protein